MQQHLLLATLCFISLAAMADPCAGGAGTAFEGSVNHLNFCISNIEMPNWWTAHSWCRAAGGHLATWNEACADQAPPRAENSIICTNLQGKAGAAWINFSLFSGKAYYIRSDYRVYYGGNDKNMASYHALCVINS